MESSPLPSGAGWRSTGGVGAAGGPVGPRHDVGGRFASAGSSPPRTSRPAAGALSPSGSWRSRGWSRLARAVEVANERLFGRLSGHLLQSQHGFGAERDVLTLVAGQHRLLPGLVVVTSNPLQDQGGGRPLEARRAGGHLLARLEHELAVGQAKTSRSFASTWSTSARSRFTATARPSRSRSAPAGASLFAYAPRRRRAPRRR